MAAVWAFLPAVAAWVAYIGAKGCGFNGHFCPDACDRFGTHVARHIVGQVRPTFRNSVARSIKGLAFVQELALLQLRDVVCDHLSHERPRKPLVVSIHGPPGVGKTYFHKLLAEAVYNMTGGPGRAAACDSGAPGEPAS